jgi:hypothetical protein
MLSLYPEKRTSDLRIDEYALMQPYCAVARPSPPL